MNKRTNTFAPEVRERAGRLVLDDQALGRITKQGMPSHAFNIIRHQPCNLCTPCTCVVDRKIAPYIPVSDKADQTDGTWSRVEIEWDESNDQYVCPEGHESKQLPGQLL